jgi:glyoxylase-like metal-dependent hydrolase (beta-lactamase superfamily II)
MINIIDLNFLGNPETIAAYLIPTSEGPVLIETGPYSTFGNLKKGVEALGYALEDIKHVLITHIHLDHAGAAWAMAELGATVYLHPFGYKHMHDPSKLVQSARRIYKEDMDRLWSDIKGIPEDKLCVVEHEETLTFGDTQIQAWYTPGHAVHHIAWQIGEELIAGDVAGVKIGEGPVVPPCPPPDINVENWKASIELLRKRSLKSIYLSHFGKISHINDHLDALENILDDWANWMYPHYQAQTPQEELVPLFQQYVEDQLKKSGVSGLDLKKYDNANPAWMSVTGLMRYWRKKEEKEKSVQK